MLCRDELEPVSREEAVSCFSALLEDLLGAVQVALHALPSEHDYLRICCEVGQAAAALLQAPQYVQQCQQHAAPGAQQPAAVEVRPVLT